MGTDRTGAHGDRGQTERLTVAEAADALGISAEAVRMRVRRGTLRTERIEGTVYVLLDTDRTRHDDDASSDRTGDRAELVEELRDRLEFVESQLQQERQAHAEARRIIAGLVERIPSALERPSEAAGAPPEASEGARSPDAGDEEHAATERPQERRSWWREFFGIGG